MGVAKESDMTEGLNNNNNRRDGIAGSYDRSV